MTAGCDFTLMTGQRCELGRHADGIHSFRIAESPLLETERSRLYDRLVERFRTQRYRNIVMDGMDARLTAVVPLASVERAIADAFGLRDVRLPAVPALGEQLREDVA